MIRGSAMVLSLLLDLYDIPEGRRDPAALLGFDLVVGNVEKRDAERLLEFDADLVFRDEIALLDLFDEDLTLLDLVCEILLGPVPLDTGLLYLLAEVVDDLADHQVKDVAAFALRSGRCSRCSPSWCGRAGLCHFYTQTCALQAHLKHRTLDVYSFWGSMYRIPTQFTLHTTRKHI
jgi:hypothetical protein